MVQIKNSMMIVKFLIVIGFILLTSLFSLIPALILNFSNEQKILTIGGFALFGLLAGIYEVSHNVQRWFYKDSQLRNKKREAVLWIIALIICILVVYFDFK